MRGSLLAGCLVLAAAVGGAAVPAAWPALATARPRADVVRAPIADTVGQLAGTVFDSLLGAPVAEARVTLPDLGRQVLTDARGRYRMDSVPSGVWLLRADLPVADSLGIRPLLERVVEVRVGQATHTDFAVPSFAQFTGVLCPGSLASNEGIIFGAVREAGSDALLMGAEVTAEWAEVLRVRGGAGLQYPRRLVRTDSTGRYALCGVSAEWLLTVQAAVGARTTGAVDLRLGERRVTRLDLLVSLELTGSDSADDAQRSRLMDSVTAQAPDSLRARLREYLSQPIQRGRARLRGTVSDAATGLPLSGVKASLEGYPAEVDGDDEGRFFLGELPGGTQILLVRRLGYAPLRVPVDLRVPAMNHVHVDLSRVEALAKVQVFGRFSGRGQDRREFDERRRLGIGRVVQGKTLERRGSQALLFALQGVPNLLVQTNGPQPGLRVRRGAVTCEPRLWLDGFRTDMTVVASLTASEIAAVEVFPRNVGVPMRFAAWDDCGTVLIWTKVRFGSPP